MDVRELKAKLKEAGVVGAGGAGFPTYAKLGEGIDTVILNCAECEPLLKPHRLLLSEHVCEVLEGFDALRKSVGAARGVVGIKPSYKEAVSALEAHIDEFENIEISYLPEIYPAGDEVVLIYETTHRVVSAGALPISVGVCVFNVETAYNVYGALCGKNVTHKYVTIAGEVKNPCTLRLPLGMSFEEAVSLAGGAVCEDAVYISGGPMTGSIVSANKRICKTTNAILVMPPNHYIVNKRRVKSSVSINRAMSACCQCRMCTDMCPRNLLGHPIEPHSFMLAAKNGDAKQTQAVLNTAFCSGCGVCEMYACPQGLSPRTLIAECKAELRNAGVKAPKPQTKPVSVRRDYARIPMSRLISRLDLTKYNVAAPLSEAEVDVKKLKIALSQSIGAAPTVVVKAGDTVTAGQCVAKADEDKLGVDLHSPIDGVVTKVKEKFIIIEKRIISEKSAVKQDGKAGELTNE